MGRGPRVGGVPVVPRDDAAIPFAEASNKGPLRLREVAVNRDYDGRQFVGIDLHRRRSVLRGLGAQAERPPGAIDVASHAIFDARVTHREEIGLSYVVFGAAVCDALAPVVVKLAGI
jgi:hypothetical protein